ncbi:MAG: carboxypeptidase-like regulatory domain-containing protein, partial [Cyclobacteriaceae bacterium]|nr:carboxypeptidase-like regulatory domain-containing protein [Cyclobacteriaceae bacterium]
MKNLLITILSLVGICGLSYSQTITQTVKGTVFDNSTQETIIGAAIILLDSDPLLGTTTNLDGEFILENVPIGRQSIKISMMGYESYFVNDLLISSGKQVVLNIGLEESTMELGEVIITPQRYKEKPLNEMATVSSRQFTVEETQRFAGGLNDPARLVSSFAGVATPSISSNGISVRGNSPSGLLWRIEEVEVPSPNHFANLTIAGAGLLTVLSNQMMGNSDFYTGAFPSEYGNATSGVFDIKLRTGNSSKREYTFQAGLLGIDFATEGPFKIGKRASYLFNYRYSTMALISPILPSNSGILKYQDLSYKINLPTKNTGTFSLWGITGYDGIDLDALDNAEWKSITDKDNSQTSLYMFASGINHQ